LLTERKAMGLLEAQLELLADKKHNKQVKSKGGTRKKHTKGTAHKKPAEKKRRSGKAKAKSKGKGKSKSKGKRR
jgi:hypothetical protein